MYFTNVEFQLSISSFPRKFLILYTNTENMFDKLQQLKELKKMRDEAMAMQKALDAETVEVEKRGVSVKITLAQRIVSIDSGGKDDEDITEAVNDAIKESQKSAARKMQQMGGFDSLKGMMGGGSN